jgi:hypothetical protein
MIAFAEFGEKQYPPRRGPRTTLLGTMLADHRVEFPSQLREIFVSRQKALAAKLRVRDDLQRETWLSVYCRRTAVVARTYFGKEV